MLIHRLNKGVVTLLLLSLVFTPYLCPKPAEAQAGSGFRIQQDYTLTRTDQTPSGFICSNPLYLNLFDVVNIRSGRKFGVLVRGVASQQIKAVYGREPAGPITGTLCPGPGQVAAENYFDDADNDGQRSPTEPIVAIKQVCDAAGFPRAYFIVPQFGGTASSIFCGQ